MSLNLRGLMLGLGLLIGAAGIGYTDDVKRPHKKTCADFDDFCLHKRLALLPECDRAKECDKARAAFNQSVACEQCCPVEKPKDVMPERCMSAVRWVCFALLFASGFMIVVGLIRRAALWSES